MQNIHNSPSSGSVQYMEATAKYSLTWWYVWQEKRTIGPSKTKYSPERERMPYW